MSEQKKQRFNIDLKARLKNPYFIILLIANLIAPVLSSTNLTVNSFTSWFILWSFIVEIFSNPSMLITMIISIVSLIYNPTTAKIGD